MTQNFKFIEEINSIQKTDFDKLVDVSDSPFINYGYLFSLENSHCVSRDTGWQPNHLISIDNKAFSCEAFCLTLYDTNAEKYCISDNR